MAVTGPRGRRMSVRDPLRFPKSPLQQAIEAAAVPKTGVAEAAPTAEAGKPEVFRDPKTGRLSGITVGEKTFLGLGPEDVAKIAAGEKRRVTIPEGTIEVGEARGKERIEEEQERITEEKPERRELEKVGIGLFAGSANKMSQLNLHEPNAPHDV